MISAAVPRRFTDSAGVPELMFIVPFDASRKLKRERRNSLPDITFVKYKRVPLRVLRQGRILHRYDLDSAWMGFGGEWYRERSE